VTGLEGAGVSVRLVGSGRIRSALLEPVCDADQWDRLVAAREGTFFHRHLFLSTISEALGLSLDLRSVTAFGSVVGVAPILSVRRGPLSTVNIVPFPYVGPLVMPGMLGLTMDALRRQERRMGCIWSQYTLTDHHSEVMPGYESWTHRTFVVPLEGRSDDDLLEGMEGGRLRSVRRALRQGLHVRPATKSEVTEVLPRLLAEPFDQQGLPAPYGPECFRLVWERLRQHPDVLCHTAVTKDGDPVAVDISFAGARTGLGWMAGRAPGRAGSDGFAALCWRALCWARERGSSEFDLVGAPTEGIAQYKRSLGGQERLYTVFNHEASAHRLAKNALARLRKGSAARDDG
jgi:hypothetical protein